MSIDLKNLTPAPWHAEGTRVDGWRNLVGSLSHAPHVENAEANAEFIALARNAFDVLMRRGWGVECDGVNEWSPTDDDGRFPRELRPCPQHWWSDPFTALVEADKWLAAQEKKG